MRFFEGVRGAQEQFFVEPLGHELSAQRQRLPFFLK
jgi:hypothetical protein